jgi:hypothetical protein
MHYLRLWVVKFTPGAFNPAIEGSYREEACHATSKGK